VPQIKVKDEQAGGGITTGLKKKEGKEEWKDGTTERPVALVVFVSPNGGAKGRGQFLKDAEKKLGTINQRGIAEREGGTQLF